MSAMTQLEIPRAEELRPPRRGGPGGRPYIGPKVQVNIPDEHYNFVLDTMENRGWTEAQYADMLREIIARGIQALRSDA
jgi:hypothetical protein